MMKFHAMLAAAALFGAVALAHTSPEAQTVTENTLTITVGLGYDSDEDATPNSTGEVVIELMPDAAPLHVERIKTLAKEGFYDGIVFHRVIEGFMAQTGDPLGNGTGGSELPDLPAEFSDLPFDRGTVGMARSANPNSGNSQFFIMFQRASHLDSQYTVFGKVTSGMDVIDAVKRGSQSSNGTVTGGRDRMVSVKVGG